MEQILVSLGFLPYGEVRKHRTKYKLGEVIFALDEVEGLGAFLEIEIPGEGDWSGKRKRVLDILAQLGIRESIRKSYLELLEEQARAKDR
jgi:adenylate cyclase class 2